MTHDPIRDPDFARLSSAERARLDHMLRHGASRRDVLGMLGAAGAGAVLAGSLYAGAARAQSETPRQGGRLILADDQTGPNDTLDPILLSSSIDYVRSRQFFSSLTRLTANLNAEPELATEFMPNDDATVWTFKLREGVEFHDGKTMTADDVVYSMNRHLGADTLSAAASLVAEVESWEKVGPLEVRANLSSPNADLPIILGTFHFKIVQDGATDFSNPVGTGPFRVAEFQPGVRSIGRRFENYWNAPAPYLDEIETIGIADANARLNALVAGDVDAIVDVPAQGIDSVASNPDLQIWATEAGSYVNIASRLDMQPSGNMDLVRAMQLLMDRQRVVKGVLKGQGSLGNDQPIGPAYADHCESLPQRELDPDQARFHFERSGIGSAAIPIVAADLRPATLDQALILQREAQKIGLNIEVQRVSSDGYFGSVWLNAPICVSTWNMRPTANSMLTLAFKSDAPWNESRFVNAQFDQTLMEVRSVTDPDRRRQMYCDLQTMIHEEAGMVIPAHVNFTDGARAYVKGLSYVPLNSFGGGEAAETLWRDDA